MSRHLSRRRERKTGSIDGRVSLNEKQLLTETDRVRVSSFDVPVINIVSAGRLTHR